MKQTLYNDIEQALRNHSSSIQVENGTTEVDVKFAMRWVLRKNPDIFWFAHKASLNEENKSLSLQYLFSQSRVKLIQASINDVILHDFNISFVRSLSQVEQVIYVYMWIISYCNYNLNSAYNQEIDSVFVRRNSVCTGYAKATQFLLNQLGIESQLVFGQLNNSPQKNDRHCWNIVKLSGKYYHLDTSLGDKNNQHLLERIGIGIKDILFDNHCSYNFFAVSTEDILQTHSIEDIDKLPLCKDSLDRNVILELAMSLELKKRSSKLGCLLSDIGSSADIYLCSNDKNTVIKKFRGENNEKCEKEFHFMKMLVGCQHLIQLNEKESDIANNELAIEQSTPILDLFYSRNFEMSIVSLLRMIRDITLAWLECASRDIVYRDIHLCNIFRGNDGIYKLGDFGSCTTIYESWHRERVGNEWFMSPETFYEGLYDEHSAIYSITMVLYFILNDLRPAYWGQHEDSEAIKLRLNNLTLPMPYLLDNRHSDLLRLIEIGSIQYREITIKDYLKFIAQTAEGYLNSKHQFKLAFNNKGFSFNNNPINVDDIEFSCCSLPPVIITKQFQKDIVDVIASLNSSDSIGNDMRVDDKEAYCRTQGFEWDSTPNENSNHSDDSANHIQKDTIDVSEAICSTMDLFSDEKVVTFEPNLISSGFGKIIGDTFNKLFKHRRKGQKVFTSVFAPTEIHRKSHLLVQVYLHLPKEANEVMLLAGEADPKAERRGYRPLACLLKNGDRVDIILNILGEDLLYTEKKGIIWQGSFTECSFEYLLPHDLNVNDLCCTLLMSVNSAIVGEMRFITSIVESPQRLYSEIITKNYQKIFISYAHLDKAKVELIARAYRAQGVDYFFDRHYLKAGDVFPQKIQDYIDSADLFILCWSKNAAQSNYVQLERRRAMERAYPKVKPFEKAPLYIYPISIEPRAELPEDMRDIYIFEII